MTSAHTPAGIDSPVGVGLDASDFATFFAGVHDYEPFPWQQRLTTQVIEHGAWPGVIDLPTGTGKTAVLDTAVFAMAARPTTAPRRVVFVIDRRIVVDQVYERAAQIRERLEAATTPVLRRVRDRLRTIGGGRFLGIAALRGGIPIDDEWTHRPDQPWIVVSTVDQFGSRLLFRGYGVTPGMRPIHAGLAGNDCLVILDEVHLSVPFAETLAQVSSLPSGPLPRRFTVVEMSATPANKAETPFRLDTDDLTACAELRRRVGARKTAELVSVRDQRSIPGAVLRIVKSLRGNSTQVHSVGVIVNRVRTARETHDALADAGYRSHLVTGRMRPLDRVDALDQIGPIVDPDRRQQGEESLQRESARGHASLGEFAVVVATQAIEVGADFSFDALVTECAPVDSLRQRFGRLDRRGTWHERTGNPAQAWVIGPDAVVGVGKSDPVYGEAIRETWAELASRSVHEKIDVGPMSLRDLPDSALAPKANAPLLLRTHMDAWVQTRPEPIVQPAIDWFLHGIKRDRGADVSIVWRWDRSTDALRLVPPRQAEFMQVPVVAARSWLAGDKEVDVADVAGPDSDSVSAGTSNSGDWVRWSGLGEGAGSRLSIKDIRPGDVLVVCPTRGGIHHGTWDPSSEYPVTDLGDTAQIAYRRRVTLRLDARLRHAIPPPTPESEADADDPILQRVAGWLESLEAQKATLDWLHEAVAKLKDGFELTILGNGDEGGAAAYYVLTQRHVGAATPAVDVGAVDGSDAAASFTGSGVTLSDHLAGVGERAAQIACRLGLAAETVADLRLAGQLHDLGKVDARFQLQLVGGDPVELEMRREAPLAKSLPGVRPTRLYPRGMRHEVASVAMIGSNSDVLLGASDEDLVLHLVGTHHGWARPLPPIIEDPSPQHLAYTVADCPLETTSDLVASTLALDMADRFWRLVERYGYHGLAWLEAVLRLADHQQSAEEGKIERRT